MGGGSAAAPPGGWETGPKGGTRACNLSTALNPTITGGTIGLVHLVTAANDQCQHTDINVGSSMDGDGAAHPQRTSRV